MVEALVVIAILGILIVVSVPVFGDMLVRNQLIESTDRLRQTIRVAQTRSLTGLNDSAHGVFVDINIGAPDNLVLYQGSSYLARDTDYDRAETFDDVMFLSTNIFGTDITFTKTTGLPSATGTITVHHSNQGVSTTTITDLGTILND